MVSLKTVSHLFLITIYHILKTDYFLIISFHEFSYIVFLHLVHCLEDKIHINIFLGTLWLTHKFTNFNTFGSG
jgi:hypothetical protein